MVEPAPTQIQALILRAQAGDEAAWSALVEGYAEGLRRRVRKRLSPPVRRRVSESDVVQETWMMARRKLSDFEFQGEESFRAWLGAIAENTTRGLVKRHARAAQRDVRTEVTRGSRKQTAHHPGTLPTASSEATGRELRVHIETAMGDLSPDHRTVIELLQHRRVTIAEAGELMGRSTNAVKKLHGRALAELAERLGVRGRGSDEAD